NSGTTPEQFTISLSNPVSQSVTVMYSTIDGSAVSTGTTPDFTAASNVMVTFAPGETVKTITIMVNGDNIFEPNETYSVMLTGTLPTGVSFGHDTGVGTIVNDDPLPAISIADAAPVMEGNSGTTDSTFTVSLSNPSQSTITVMYSTLDGTATVAGGDYMATNG